MQKGLRWVQTLLWKNQRSSSKKSSISVLRLPSPAGDRDSVFRLVSESRRRSAAESGQASKRMRSNSSELRIYAVTWNMNGQVQLDAFAKLIEHGTWDCDLYIFGLQEAPNCSMRRVLLQILGKNYISVAKTIMGSLHLYVFAKSSLQHLVSDNRVDKVRFKGFGGVVGRQKGTVAASFRIADSSFLFISSHFAAHRGNLRERNVQYMRARKKMFSRPITNSCLGANSYTTTPENVTNSNVAIGEGDLVDECDVVVWLGDLNYRIEGSRKLVKSFLQYDLNRLLWKRDQLFNEVDKGKVFSGFVEGPLRFKPTYKYDVGTDNYDTSEKERVPSWTDRILIKVKDDSAVRLDVVDYDAIDSLRVSDHRPVKALLHLTNLK